MIENGRIAAAARPFFRGPPVCALQFYLHFLFFAERLRRDAERTVIR